MKKIIVTGGLGFIGSNLIDLLIKKKFKVINIDKVSYSSNFYNVKEHIDSKYYKFCKIDINSQYRILEVLKKEKPIAIFNLAAEYHVDR
jgi:dTDP-glucose 4,6-dehydratase